MTKKFIGKSLEIRFLYSHKKLFFDSIWQKIKKIVFVSDFVTKLSCRSITNLYEIYWNSFNMCVCYSYENQIVNEFAWIDDFITGQFAKIFNTIFNLFFYGFELFCWNSPKITNNKGRLAFMDIFTPRVR